MHWFVQQWDLIDKQVLILFLYGIGLGVVAGVAFCHVTHRQRGIEVDRPLSDNLPIPPAPIIVPDHVPNEWTDNSWEGSPK